MVKFSHTFHLYYYDNFHSHQIFAHLRHCAKCAKICTGYPRHRENGKKKSLFRENTGNLEILSKHREDTGNLVCSGCKFPDSKGKRCFDICRENFHFFGGAGKVSFVNVIGGRGGRRG